MPDRPSVQLPEPLMAAYKRLEERENRIRLYTSHQHGEPNDFIALYQIGLYLLHEAFEPGRTYSYHGPRERPRPQAYGTYHLLLGLAARSAKPACDLLLAGYYSEGMSLIRTMMEGWGRAVYVQARPSEHGRWHAPPDDMPLEERMKWGYGKPEPNFGSEIVDVIENEGTEYHRTTAKEMELRYHALSNMTHPSGESITQLQESADGKLVFGPDYSRPYCEHGFNHGIFVQLALLREIRSLGHQSDAWHYLATRLEYLYEPLHVGMKQLLATEANRREEERRWRRLGPRPEEVRAARKTITEWQSAMNRIHLGGD